MGSRRLCARRARALPETSERESVLDDQRVFIANFGQGNYEWPVCLEDSTVATMNDPVSQKFWEAGDREGFIANCIANNMTAAGERPTRPVASRWFNLMTIIAETSNDIWIHRADNRVWWTKSKPDQARIIVKPDPLGKPGEQVHVCHKPCEPWSDRTRRGTPLIWDSLHPKAKDFLSTQGTLQQLQPDNAAYALALIEATDLSPWHDRANWMSRQQRAGHSSVRQFDSRQTAVVRMAMTAEQTAKAANGQSVETTMKEKQFKFRRQELEAYLTNLLSDQEDLCAISSLPLQFDGDDDDPEMRPSLDRIDSDGHYEKGNLQVVCRFINRWKGADDDAQFRRLISVLRRE